MERLRFDKKFATFTIKIDKERHTDIPQRSSPTNAQLYEPARRGTVAEAYELIESDLKMAMETLKELDQNNSRNHLRYSRSVASLHV